MKIIYPDYYPAFRCIAADCRRNCCVGWEIDIDPDTLRRYDAMPGPLGERLARCIDRKGDTASFRLTERERCPFLNDENLCDIILEAGHGALCQICADHPRFRNAFSGRVEMGLGLCCEAACALVLNAKEPVRLIAAGEDASETEQETAFFAWRDRLLAAAQNRALPVAERMHLILNACGLPLPDFSLREWALVYLGLERMDEAWTAVLTRALSPLEAAPLDEIAKEQLLVYFLYRYLSAGFLQGDLAGYAAFAVLSAQMICRLCAAPEELAETARLYSAEIEYSDENVQTLIDVIYESEEEP